MQRGQRGGGFQFAGMHIIRFHRAAHRVGGLHQEAILDRPAVEDDHRLAAQRVAAGRAQALEQRRDLVAGLHAGFERGDLQRWQFLIQDRIFEHVISSRTTPVRQKATLFLHHPTRAGIMGAQ